MNIFNRWTEPTNVDGDYFQKLFNFIYIFFKHDN